MNEFYKKLQEFMTLVKANDPERHKELAIKVHQAVLGSMKQKPNIDKQEAVGPDISSAPDIINTPGSVSLPFQITGPVMLNVRDSRKKKKKRSGIIMANDLKKSLGVKLSDAINKKWGQPKQQALQPSGDAYHIHDVTGPTPFRITSKPIPLADIHAKWGKNIEQKGFRLIPHKLNTPQGPKGK